MCNSDTINVCGWGGEAGWGARAFAVLSMSVGYDTRSMLWEEPLLGGDVVAYVALANHRGATINSYGAGPFQDWGDGEQQDFEG